MAGAAQAATAPPSAAAQLERINALLLKQEKELAAQRQVIEAQQQQITELRQRQSETLESIRARGAGPPPAEARQTAPAEPADTPVVRLAAADPARDYPAQPVGERPQEKEPVSSVDTALPEGMTVLTRSRRFVLEPSLEYTRSSSNRLVFRGVEIIPGLQLGLVDANTADRDTVIGTLAGRYGITDRFELEVRAPYVYRHDRLTTLQQQVATGTAPVNQTMTLEGRDLGDVEATARYQINRGKPGSPIFIGNLRFKSATGTGPYDVRFDTSGVASELATGSGFYGLGPSVTMLMPSDPVVIFASLGYLHNFSRKVDKTFGTTRVGKVEPGGSIDAAIGFGFALNPNFSFSLGYSNSYIFGAKQTLNGTRFSSNDLEAGALTMGWSYRLKNGLNLSNNFEFGVTPDAPNLRVVVRTPFSF